MSEFLPIPGNGSSSFGSPIPTNIIPAGTEQKMDIVVQAAEIPTEAPVEEHAEEHAEAHVEANVEAPALEVAAAEAPVSDADVEMQLEDGAVQEAQLADDAGAEADQHNDVVVTPPEEYSSKRDRPNFHDTNDGYLLGTCVSIARQTHGTFTGNTFARYNFSDATETLIIIVDGSEVEVTLNINIPDVAAAANLIAIADARIDVEGNVLKITSNSQGELCSSISIKSTSGINAKALFGAGTSNDGTTVYMDNCPLSFVEQQGPHDTGHMMLISTGVNLSTGTVKGNWTKWVPCEIGGNIVESQRFIPHLIDKYTRDAQDLQHECRMLAVGSERPRVTGTGAGRSTSWQKLTGPVSRIWLPILGKGGDFVSADVVERAAKIVEDDNTYYNAVCNGIDLAEVAAVDRMSFLDAAETNEKEIHEENIVEIAAFKETYNPAFDLWSKAEEFVLEKRILYEDADNFSGGETKNQDGDILLEDIDPGISNLTAKNGDVRYDTDSSGYFRLLVTSAWDITWRVEVLHSVLNVSRGDTITQTSESGIVESGVVVDIEPNTPVNGTMTLKIETRIDTDLSCARSTFSTTTGDGNDDDDATRTIVPSLLSTVIDCYKNGGEDEWFECFRNGSHENNAVEDITDDPLQVSFSFIIFIVISLLVFIYYYLIK